MMSGEESRHEITSPLMTSGSLPRVQEDRPFLDVGHLHYVLRRPWVFPVHLPDLIRIVRFDDDQGAGPIRKRSAEDDHSSLEYRVHVARMFVPEGLFTRRLVWVPERAGLQKRGIVCRVRRHFASPSETTLLRIGIRRALYYCQSAVNVDLVIFFPVTELIRIKMGIEASLREQLLVRAAFDYAPVFEREDDVGLDDRFQVVGDDDDGLARGQASERFEH